MALTKHTNIELSSYEGQITLKDRFLTQSAPYIRQKLQIIREPGVTLNETVNVATLVFYNWDQEMEAKAQ